MMTNVEKRKLLCEVRGAVLEFRTEIARMQATLLGSNQMRGYGEILDRLIEVAGETHEELDDLVWEDEL